MSGNTCRIRCRARTTGSLTIRKKSKCTTGNCANSTRPSSTPICLSSTNMSSTSRRMQSTCCGGSGPCRTGPMSKAGKSAPAITSIRIWPRSGSTSSVMSVAAIDTKPLLEVLGLQMHFPVTEGIVISRKVGEVKAVDGIDFTVNRGETLGLVGESGCGKTTTGRCILRLERPTAGQILFDGRDVNQMERPELTALRRRIQVIFQDPYSSLNPRMKVGQIIAEPIKVHGVERNAARRRTRVRELLSVCGLDPKFTD